MNKTIIIGSGISGLTAALLLHRQGHDVTVVEQQRQAGGALHRFKRQGISFDVGFHYTGGLAEGEILSTLWKYCGLQDSIKPITFPDNAADCIQIEGFPETVHGYYSYDRFEEELFIHFPQEKEGIRKFFQVIKETGENIPFYNMSSPLTEFLRQLAFPEQKTLGGLIRSCTTNPSLQATLSHPVFLHGVNPNNIGLTMHASVAHPIYSGMYSVDQGGQGIADAYIHKLNESGIELLSDTPVEAILAENGKVTGVSTPKGDVPASNVIFTGHPALLPDLVTPGALRKVYCDRLKEMNNTCSMFMVFGTVEEYNHNSKLTWNNYYSMPQGLDIPVMDSCLPEDCFFLSGCRLREAVSDEHGCQKKAVILMRPATWEESTAYDLGRNKRTEEYKGWKHEQGKRLVNSVNSKWNGLLQGFQVINTASPLTFRDQLKYVQGSAYGVQHSTDQFSVGARTRLSGLWLSGQSTLMPGILGASLSALITVGGMSDLESLWDEIKDHA